MLSILGTVDESNFMSPERFKDVERLYTEVLNVSPNKRSSYLQESCGDDVELRNEIESLLSFESSFDSRIDNSPKSLVAEVFSKARNSDFVGKKINQYKIISLLGMGGMGAVYLAQDAILGRKVAIKLMSTDFGGELSKPIRFFQEAKSASALNHPNILTVHEIGEFEGANYLVTEYVEGRTLKKYLFDEEHSLRSILEIALQILAALTAAHEAGITHRDIKPDNIMIRNDGMVKVLDFGLAKLSDTWKEQDVDLEGETVVKHQTIEGMILGTPQYMSPEQARGQRVDSRSDIFSFGIVLYEMLSGQVPFSGVNEIDTIGSILKDEPKPLSELNPEISDELDRLVAKTLRKDREKRFQNIKDLYIDLNDIKKSVEPNMRIPTPTASQPVADTLKTTGNIVSERRFSIIHAALFLLLAAVIGGTLWWYSATGKIDDLTVAELKTLEVVSWSSSPQEFYSFGSFSPDGKMVAFSSTRTGNRNIWVKQTNSGDSVQVTKDEFNSERPIWSPSGEEIAFFSARNGKAGIWRIPVFGGSAKLIAEVVDDSSTLLFWSANNLIYYYSRAELYSIDAATGATKKVTDLQANGINPGSLDISRDEKLVAYSTTQGETFSAWIDRVEGGNAKKVASFNAEIKNIAWHADNRRIFFSAIVDGTFQIFIGDADGSKPRQITFAERDCFVVDASDDGMQVLYGSAKEESDIWAVDIGSEKESTVAADIDSELWANVSPDGKSIVYQSVKNLSQGNKIANGNILTKKLNSDDPPQQIAENGFLPVWSPDSQKIAFVQFTGTIEGLHMIDQTGGNQKQLFGEGTIGPSYSVLPYNHIQTNDFAWSADSRKIAHMVIENGRRALQLVNTDGSGTIKLTDESISDRSLYCPIWSPDGKQIAFTSKTVETNADGVPKYGVYVVDVETKELKQVIHEPKFLRLLGWAPDGSSLFLASVGSNPMDGLHTIVSLLKVEMTSGKLEEIAQQKDTYLYNIYLSPNGRQIAYVSHIDDKDNIFLMPAAGGQGKQITNNSDARLFFSSLAWSPDNKTIFFGKQSRYSLLSRLINFN